jgi:DNA-binding MarR family transcriptional regulator
MISIVASKDSRTKRSAGVALAGDELRLWRNFLQWSEGVTAAVAQALAVEVGLSQPDYEVLKRLLEADGALPRQALEQSLSWSPSRLSHQLRRMEARGLVARAGSGHGRHVNVEIADGGRGVMAAADRAHAQAVRRHLLDALPDDVRGFLYSAPGVPTSRDGSTSDGEH